MFAILCWTSFIPILGSMWLISKGWTCLIIPKDCIIVQKSTRGPQDHSAGQGTCCQAGDFESNSWDPYGGMRELTAAVCPQSTTYVSWHSCLHSMHKTLNQSIKSNNLF